MGMNHHSFSFFYFSLNLIKTPITREPIQQKKAIDSKVEELTSEFEEVREGVIDNLSS